MALALLRRFVAGYAARVLGRDTEAAEEADEGDAETEDASGDDAHLDLDASFKQRHGPRRRYLGHETQRRDLADRAKGHVVWMRA